MESTEKIKEALSIQRDSDAELLHDSISHLCSILKWKLPEEAFVIRVYEPGYFGLELRDITDKDLVDIMYDDDVNFVKKLIESLMPCGVKFEIKRESPGSLLSRLVKALTKEEREEMLFLLK